MGGEDIVREAWQEAPDLRGDTFCHMCEMALTFTFLPFYRRPMSGWAWRRVRSGGMPGACGQDGAKGGSDDFSKVGCHWF